MTPIIVIFALLIVFYGSRILLRRFFSTLDSVPGPPRKSILTGNLTQFIDHEDSTGTFQRELEQNYSQVVKLHGLFGDRQLFVFDPAALHSILVKNEDMYALPSQLRWLYHLLFGKGILSTMHDDHRKYRKTMVPAFSTANLRRMVPLFYDVAQRTRDGLISPNVIHGPQALDMNPILCRTSLEWIGRTGIGYSFDPMLPGQEQSNRYAQALRAIVPTAFEMQLAFPLLPFIMNVFPSSFLRLMINVLPLPALHKLRDIVDFTDATAAQLIRDRKTAMSSGKVNGSEDDKNIMSLLMKGNASTESRMHLTDAELVACTSVIMFAATDTTASSMNRMFHVLAMHPNVQEKLRAEILSVSEHLDHDTLVALPYLDGVIHEIMRLYPAGPMDFREALADTVLPLSTPIAGVDGKVMDSISIPKGTSIYVAIAAANHNKQIWGDDALEFRPERWTNGKADAVTTKMCGVYGNTMTFVGGGRSCIGFKFAQLEMKVVACVLLRAFKFSAPDAGVQWLNSGIMFTPHVNGQPALPIVVERLKD